MKQKSRIWKNIGINTALVMISLGVTYVLIECFFFRLFLPWLPLKTWGYIDADLLPLAQSSKQATIPHDYIMIVGDSYVVGLGDWYIRADKNRHPGEGIKA